MLDILTGGSESEDHQTGYGDEVGKDWDDQ